MTSEMRSSSALRAGSSSTGATPRRRGETGASGRLRASLGACGERAGTSENEPDEGSKAGSNRVTNTSTRVRNQKRYLRQAAIETDAKVYRPGSRPATYPQLEGIIGRPFQKLRAAQLASN